MFTVVTTYMLHNWEMPKVWVVAPRIDLREAVIVTVSMPNQRFARPPPVVIS